MTDDVLTIAEEIRECCERLSFRSSCARDYLGYINATAAAHEGAHLLAFATEIAEARRLKAQTCETCEHQISKAGVPVCMAHGERCDEFGNHCGAWEAK